MMLFAVITAVTMLWAAEGGTLSSSITPIDPTQTVTLTYDGTGTNFANWEPQCFIHTWLVAAEGKTLSKSYTTEWATCNGDEDYAALDSKVKMTRVGAGQYTISMNIQSFFDVAEVDLDKIGQIGVMVRAQYDGESNKTKELFALVEYTAPSGGESSSIYIWNGIGSTSAAIQTGGTAEAVQTSGENMVVGASQKGNYCFKGNKGFNNGEYYIGIALNNGVNAGDTIRIAYFRTGDKNSYILGMDFSADKASASTAHQILLNSDPQVLASNGTPADSIFIVPAGVSNAKYVRLYRNSGSTGMWVAKFELIKKTAAPAPPATPNYYIAGTMTEWATNMIKMNAGNADTLTLDIALEADSLYEFKVVRIEGNDTTWFGNAEEATMVYGNSTGWWLKGDKNIGLQTTTKANYTFIFKANDNNEISVVIPEPAKKYYAKYAPKWTWTLLNEKEGKWLTDTIVYAGIGVNINDQAADENNIFFSNTVNEAGVRPIAGAEIADNDTVLFAFNPADSTLTAIMVGKYVKPVIPTKAIRLVPTIWNVEGVTAKFAAVTWKQGQSMFDDGVLTDWFIGGDTVVGQIPVDADSIAFARFNGATAVPVLDMSVIWNHTDMLAIDPSLIFTITDWGEECSLGYWGAAPEEAWYLVGDMTDWETNKIQMVNGTAKATLSDVNRTYGFKILKIFGAQKTWYGNDGIMNREYHENWTFTTAMQSNCGLLTDVAGEYTFTFTQAGNDIQVTVTYPEKGETGLEQVMMNTEVTKFIYDGQLYILRDGKIYNVQGAIVR